jgi:hypothetical protein
MHRIFIGHDPRQIVSLTTLVHSIKAHAKGDVQIVPLVLEDLPITRQGLTPFTYSRFLVPYLCEYQGFGLFLDADMLVTADIAEVFEIGRAFSSTKAAFVMQDQPAFEWASMILFNCAHPSNRILTPGHIENPQTTNLHKIGWLERNEIGSLPKEWNTCVPYTSEPPENPKLIHFTQGVPHWWETADQPHADKWLKAREEAGAAGGDITASHSWFELMGRSVHAKHVLARLIKTGVCKDEMDYARKAGLIKEAAE